MEEGDCWKNKLPKGGREKLNEEVYKEISSNIISNNDGIGNGVT